VRNRQVEKSPEMNDLQLQSVFHIPNRRLALEGVPPLLQGGVALGADQGGVYEALGKANIDPDWIVTAVEQAI
jgi:hypothetical protein